MRHLFGISHLIAVLGFFLYLGKTVASVEGSSPYDLVSPLPLDAELNYEFSGSTVLSRKHVKLTTDAKDKRGYITSTNGGELPQNFDFTMDFKLEGEGRTLYGDGMALWFTEEKPQLGLMMGLNELYKGVAVIIDTYRNGKAGRLFPRMILAKNDGTDHYDKDNDGRANEIGSCGLRGIHNNQRQEYSSVRVSYSSALKSILVEVNYRNRWEPCASAELELGPVSYISVSAATGELTDSHVIKDLRLVDHGMTIPPAILKDQSSGASSKNSDDEEEYIGGSFFSTLWFLIKSFFKLLFLIALVLAALRGWKEFKKYRQRREDDLYKLN